MSHAVPEDSGTVTVALEVAAQEPQSEDGPENPNDSMSKEKRVRKIRAFLDEGRGGLDVWQVAAFKLGTEYYSIHIHGWKDLNGIAKLCRFTLWMVYPAFSLLCQIVAIYNLWTFFVLTPGEVHVYENYPVMFLVFGVFIFVNSLNARKSRSNDGFYGGLNYIPRVSKGCCFRLHSAPLIGDKLRIFADYGFLNMTVLNIGFFVNMIIWVFCVFLNLRVLLFSPDPLDVILNIIAVYFIADIDNMMVPPDSYVVIAEWFEDSDNVSRIRAKPMSAMKYNASVAMNVVVYALSLFVYLVLWYVLLWFHFDFEPLL